MTYEQRQAKAYRLYVRYQTHTQAYRDLAASFGLSSTGELNRQMCEIYNAKRRARLAKRALTA